jgi:hypothetical protein
LIPIFGTFTFWLVSAAVIYHTGCMAHWARRTSPAIFTALVLACVLAPVAR